MQSTLTHVHSSAVRYMQSAACKQRPCTCLEYRQAMSRARRYWCRYWCSLMLSRPVRWCYLFHVMPQAPHQAGQLPPEATSALAVAQAYTIAFQAGAPAGAPAPVMPAAGAAAQAPVMPAAGAAALAAAVMQPPVQPAAQLVAALMAPAPAPAPGIPAASPAALAPAAGIPGAGAPPAAAPAPPAQVLQTAAMPALPEATMMPRTLTATDSDAVMGSSGRHTQGTASCASYPCFGMHNARTSDTKPSFA